MNIPSYENTIIYLFIFFFFIYLFEKNIYNLNNF